MNKLLNISLCLILTVNFGYSQSIKRSVISSFGSSSSNSTTYLSETFGQPSSIGTVSDGLYYIRQGFEQPVGCVGGTIFSTTNPFICSGNSITVGNSTYSTTGTYIDSLATVFGCDSIITTNLTVWGVSGSTTTESACDSYDWNGSTYSSSGTYTFTTTNSNGCDSIASLILTINNSTTGSSSVSACNSYIWEGQTITSSGDLTHTYQSTSGCDSVHTLSVTINNSTSGSSSVSACNTYTWEGQIVSTSSILTHIYTNTTGCDSMHTLNVTINNSTTGSSSVTACETYSWEGQTVTTSNILSHTYQNSVGCDSIHTLTVNILNTTTGSSSVSACNTYTWEGQTVTSSDVLMHMYVNSLGCDSVHTLTVIINYPTSSTTTESACDSYEWNGNTYNTTGIYTYETTNSNGCDSTATLDLTLSLLNVSDITTNTSCFGSFDGSVEINVIGGLEPYNYLWDSGDLTQDLIDVAAGNYILTVTDANLCVTTHNISINDPEELILNPFVTNASCEVSDDASIDITPYGGTMPYTYLWSNGQITEDLQNIQIGEYTVLVTDFNGCEKLESISVGFDGSDNCFFIPTLFTPNGDGIHDTWVIDGLDIYPDILVQVFNRWGQLLFDSRGYTDAWDGTHNGNELPAGAYYYVIDLDNDTKPLNGAITIKR